MAEDQAAGRPPAAGNTILALGAGDEDRLRAAASDESHFAGGADLDDLVRARVNLDLLALENSISVLFFSALHGLGWLS